MKSQLLLLLLLTSCTPILWQQEGKLADEIIKDISQDVLEVETGEKVQLVPDANH